ncbi:uncharacterized protein [Nicotiana sylvestris]|uniref:uncharacterized protein n=1 Tax=Nicotiana sylvestris TaxID=4096 RepID=UPI00388CE9F0
MAEDCKLWDIICDGLYVPTKVLEELPVSMVKTNKEYTKAGKKAVEKNFRAKKILVCGIGLEEYNRISTCDITKAIWEALQIAHEGTTQVKQSKIDMPNTEYELFKMRDDESIQDMHTRFTSIINELHSLEETIPRNKLELAIEELIENLKTYELKRKINNERREPKKEKNLVLKANYNDSSEEDNDMAYLTKRFQKMVRRNGEMLKRDSSNRPRNCDLCYKCGKHGHFMKDSPLLKQELFKNHHEKIAKTDPVPVKDFKRKRSADNMMRQALAAWGDSSSESEDEHDTGDSSMMVVEGEKIGHNSTFALMAQLDDDEDNGNKEKEKSDLLAEIADLRETIVKPWTKSKPESSGKGKEIASEEHIMLENELKAMRFRRCAEIAKNELLQTNLERVKNDFEKSLKWTWSSEATTAMHTNDCENRQGAGFQKGKTPYNPYSKYVTISDNCPCTPCGNTGHFKEDVQAKNQSVQKNKVFAEMGYILGVEKVRKSLTHSIENVYYVNGLKYTLLSVSQIYDKGNKVEFLSKICTVTDLVTGEIVLVAKRYKNIYVADFESLQNGDPSCLKVVDDEVELWHRRLGHACFSVLNKLIQKNLVHDLPMSQFNMQKVCDACARGKHMKSSFKSKEI